MPLANNKCPTCNKTINGAKAVDGSDIPPHPGDVSICIYCASILSFQYDLSVKRMDIDELLKLPMDVQEDLRKALSAMMKVRMKG